MTQIYSQYRKVAPKNLAIEFGVMKSFLKIDHQEEDGLIKEMIIAATNRFEAYTNCALITQIWSVTFKFPDRFIVPIPMRPAQSIIDVDLVDCAGCYAKMPSENISLVPESGYAKFQSIPLVHLLKIHYIAGYGDVHSDVPTDIKWQIMSHVARLYENRSRNIVELLPAAEYESFKIMRL